MELKVDMPHTQVHPFTRQFLEPAQDLLVQRRDSWSFILRSRIRSASKSWSEKPTEDRSAIFKPFWQRKSEEMIIARLPRTQTPCGG
jgi:hypothetical protein